MNLLIDVSYLSFKIAMAYHVRWELLQQYMNAGATLFFDDNVNVRMETYGWYKSNRGSKLPLVTQQLRDKAKRFQSEIWIDYRDRCVVMDGAEADDVIAMAALADPTAMVISEDHDMLQLPDAVLADQHMRRWGVARMWKYTKLPLRQGRDFMAYQLLHGCSTDTVPRRLLSKDIYTAPYCFSTPDPLAAAIDMLPYQHVVESLNCLLMPSPLLTGRDPIEQALALR